MSVNVRRRALHEVSASMPASKAFRDDLRGQAEIRAAFCTVQARRVAIQELVGFGGRDYG